MTKLESYERGYLAWMRERQKRYAQQEDANGDPSAHKLGPERLTSEDRHEETEEA